MPDPKTPDPDATPHEPIGYTGPPRDPATVIAAAQADEELMRQVRASLEEERLGIPGVPWRRVREEARARDEARGRAHRTA